MHPLISYVIIIIIVFSLPLVAVRYGKQYLVALMPIYIITANVFAESFFKSFGVVQSLAVPIFCATFLVSNILNELYGRHEARRAVFVGFIGQLVFVILLIIIKNTDIFPDALTKYETTFKIIPRLVAGSIVAYLASQLTDIALFHILKRRTGKKGLFTRNTVSTSISQFVDTTVLVYIAFYNTPLFASNDELWSFILSTWLFKICVALIDYPFIWFATRSKTK